MNKKKIVLTIVSAAVLIAICVALGLSGVLSPYERQIKLAYKLLDEGSYEEAILAFDKAIEIDVRRDKAYIGKADVYVARFDENTLDDIKKVLEIAYGHHYNDDNVVSAIMRLANELMEKGQGELAMALLDYGFELTKDERIVEHKNEVFNIFAGGFLSDLYGMFEAGNKEAVRKEIQSDKYLNFAKLVNDADYKYIYFPDKNKSQTGKGIALYYVENKNYGKVFVYYGDFEKGNRSGSGTWAGANGIQYYWYEGQWSNDAPNGEGELIIVKDESKINKEPGHTYAITTSVKGAFKDGKYHGAIYETWYMDDGDTIAWNPITSIDGIYQEMNPLPEDIINTDYAKENYAEGQYLVSVTEGGSDLWNKGTLNCIIGFAE